MVVFVEPYPNGKDAIVRGTSKNALMEEEAVADFYTPEGTMGTAINAGSNTSSVRVVSPKGERQIYLQANSYYKVSNLTLAPSASLGIAGWKSLASNIFFLLTSDRSDTAAFMYGPNGSQIRLTTGPNGTGMQLFDDPGTLRAVLGNTNLQTVRTGSKETTALSSLVLFDKEGNVLWKAP